MPTLFSFRVSDVCHGQVAMMGFQELMRRNGGLFVVAEPEEEEEEGEEDGHGA